MYVPKDRFLNWDSSTKYTADDGTTKTGWVWPSSSGSSRDSNGSHTWYNPNTCPKIGIYKASLNGSIAEAADYDEDVQEKRNFTVTLDWLSSLKTSLGWDGSETYDVYQIADDGTETLIQTNEDNTTHSYNVPQYEQGYTLNYKVVCYPTGSADNKVGPAITNMVTLAVPGYKDEFMWIYGYHSRFEETPLVNSYKNEIKLSPYRLKSDEVAKRVIWRKNADGTNKQKIATVTINTDGSYTAEYNNEMATTDQYRYDTDELVLEGNTKESSIIINDYFLVSTADGGDKAGSYIYYIDAIAGSEFTNSSVSIPVYASTMASKFNTDYDLSVVEDDIEGDYDLTSSALVNFQDVNDASSIISYDIYKDHEITYHGTSSVSDEVDGYSHNFAGEMTANSIYGYNTYGTNRVTVQGSAIDMEFGNQVVSVLSDASKYAYGATITLKPTVAEEVAPYVYYYRVWRMDADNADVLNTLKEKSGAKWGSTTYSNIQCTYPEGEVPTTSDPLTIRDVWYGNSFISGGTYTVNYKVRLYTTNLYASADTDESGASKVTKRVGTSDKVDCYIVETTISVPFTNNTPTAVNDVTTSRMVKSVQYVNMLGKVSNHPFDGMNIEVTTYTDGTKESKKILR